MPNTYFQFKQFTIQQDKTQMKVCTDSCLFGAWVANEINNQTSPSTILDIGTGTGLLSLMIAQKINGSHIDAVEPDATSAQQAKENFAASAWSEKLKVFECRIQDFTAEKKYDFIVSNPPFYEDDLLSKSDAKNRANHHTGLRFSEWMSCTKSLLSEGGSFAVLLPYRRANEFEVLANEAHYFVNKKVGVKPTENHPYFRSMLLFSKEQKGVLQEEVIIKNKGNEYSSAFHFLLKDYYLYL